MLFDISPEPFALDQTVFAPPPDSFVGPSEEPVTRAMIEYELPQSWPNPFVFIEQGKAIEPDQNSTFEKMLDISASYFLGQGREAYERRFRTGMTKWQKLACQFVKEQFVPGDGRILRFEPSMNLRRGDRTRWYFSHAADGYVRIMCYWPTGVAAQYQTWITRNGKHRFKIDED